MRNNDGTGATAEDRGEAESLHPLLMPGASVAEMTPGQRMIADNLRARAAKENRVKQSSAAGAGSIGGRTQAWIDRVGRSGMRAYDKSLTQCKDATLDTLRVLDHSTCPTNYNLITALVKHLVGSSGQGLQDANGEGGAILIFLPGLHEIKDLIEELQGDAVLGQQARFRILPLHSELSTEEQTHVFQQPPRGVTKIVVATNIAEASITIEDVTCVIDSGGHKEVAFDPAVGITALRLARISEANAVQRAGRAGRVRAGCCYHLYMQREVLQPQQQPEVQRSPLEPLCLRAKALGLGSIRGALMGLPSPPHPSAVDHAIRALAGLQLIEALAPGETDPSKWADEKLTSLGRILATIPTSPRAGKLAVLGAVFGCLDPCLAIAATLDSRSPFVAPFRHRDAAQQAKRDMDPLSDHLAVLKAGQSQIINQKRRDMLCSQTKTRLESSIKTFKPHLIHG